MHFTNNITINVFRFIVQECDKGSYGIECNGTCGHCRDVKQCSNVNGSCLTGCDAGYKGDLCKSREYTNTKVQIEETSNLLLSK